MIREAPNEGIRTVKILELRRHAERDRTEDRLSVEGREHAEAVGRELRGPYNVVFVSPARRAAETAALFLRGSGQQLPTHAVVPGLAGKEIDDGAAALGAVISDIIDEVPDGGIGLAVGHTPLIEDAVLGLTGVRIDPLGECEGVRITRTDDGRVSVQELRP
jgi:phosphohistidine phosphatase SixA